MTRVAERVLTGVRADSVASAAEKIAGESIAEIEAALPKALAGDRSSVRTYLHAFNHMADEMVDAINEARPNLILLAPMQHRALDSGPKAEAGGAPWIRSVLEGEAMRAPFSDWVGTMGSGRGVALAFVSSLRQTLPDVKPLQAPARMRLPDWDLENRDVIRFYRAIADLLEASEMPLERIQRLLNLNRTEMAALFGVSRQAVEKWESQGVPADRTEKLSTIAAIVDLLEAQLKPDRIPGVARRSASGYGDRSILEAIAAGDDDMVLAELRNAFDWAATA
jgi:DNA-binding XRE family transcriptional regulator